ncbi:MAG TPA: D-aminoacyl-tRNA deacylase [archaeon]|nr:D-aminoacyl-tRNA deacylase [archaeon]
MPQKIAIVCALEDEASVNILKELKKIGVPNWANLYEFSEDTIFLSLDKVLENQIIVLSKHESKAGKKSLTVHYLGNFGEAKFGGENKLLCGALAKIGTNYIRALNNEKEKLKNQTNNLNDFEICFEVTHHGPHTEKNVVLIEIGSSKIEWENEFLGKIIANIVLNSTLIENKDIVGIGIGGIHYATEFTKFTIRENFSIGHICPNYNLENLDLDLLNQMITKSEAKIIILNWKGLKSFKQKILDLCQKTNLPIKKI